MAIGFMPTDEDTEARYERLNRILLELYDLVQLINREGPRPPGPAEPRSTPSQPRGEWTTSLANLLDLLANTAIRSRQVPD